MACEHVPVPPEHSAAAGRGGWGGQWARRGSNKMFKEEPGVMLGEERGRSGSSCRHQISLPPFLPPHSLALHYIDGVGPRKHIDPQGAYAEEIENYFPLPLAVFLIVTLACGCSFSVVGDRIGQEAN